MNPLFSIVIPTYRRPQALAGCLDALAKLDFPRDRFEVVVVNDGGEPLDAVVAPFADRLDVRLLHQPNAGPGAARNRGAGAARGEYIAFTDDDCFPDPQWLMALSRHLLENPQRMVGGRVINVLPTGEYPCSAASQVLITYLYSYYNADRQAARFLTSNNIALSRTAFMAAGGFDTAYHRAAAEDREFCDRWAAGGKPMSYEDDVLVRHAHPMKFGAFVRQHFEYGRGALHFRQARAARAQDAVKIEPFSFYSRLLRSPWTQQQPRPILTAALLFLSQAANALGFFWEKFKGRDVPQALDFGSVRSGAAGSGDPPPTGDGSP